MSEEKGSTTANTVVRTYGSTVHDKSHPCSKEEASHHQGVPTRYTVSPARSGRHIEQTAQTVEEGRQSQLGASTHPGCQVEEDQVTTGQGTQGESGYGETQAHALLVEILPPMSSSNCSVDGIHVECGTCAFFEHCQHKGSCPNIVPIEESCCRIQRISVILGKGIGTRKRQMNTSNSYLPERVSETPA
jgi:hypothetical protein